MLGYRLGYGPRYADMEEWRWRELAGDVTRIQLEELHPFTQYLVSLQVVIDNLFLSLPKTNLLLGHLTECHFKDNSDDHFKVLNPEGGGPLARVVVITDEDGQYFLSFLFSPTQFSPAGQWNVFSAINDMQQLQCQVPHPISLLEKRLPPQPWSPGLDLFAPTE